MNIQSISIQNFRNIGNTKTFYLNPNFTVFIGVNGKGKSTILYALRVACGSYLLPIPDIKHRHIQEDEIRIIESGKLLLKQFPVNVEAVAFFPGISEPVIWRRQRLEYSNSTTSTNADVGPIRKIAFAKYNRVQKESDDKVDLPVIAFFGITRAVGAGRITKNSRIQRLGRQLFKEGYQDWDEMKAVKFHYEEWLGTYDTLVALGKEYPNTKEIFFSAVKTANPFITQIEFINGELWVKIKIDDDETGLLPLSLHSDGIHYFTAMVAEIAFRCIVLNGYKNEKSISETLGIVMIDEIDLHLHPNWQRHVVHDLKKAFPKIQFVVTTHSPFIVQSLKSEELIILDEDIKKDGDPFKKSIEEVAANEMGVDDIPRSIEFLEMQKVAEEYYTLLEAGKTSEIDDLTQQLRNRLNELEELFGEDPAFVAALKIERKAKGL
ncbi:MAG: AAA family ATPase [Chlorobiales bacterium]|nr:AAA family ATPase [Chlorobiales bacterium]